MPPRSGWRVANRDRRVACATQRRCVRLDRGLTWSNTDGHERKALMANCKWQMAKHSTFNAQMPSEAKPRTIY